MENGVRRHSDNSIPARALRRQCVLYSASARNPALFAFFFRLADKFALFHCIAETAAARQKTPAERLRGANQRRRVGRGGLAKIAINALESPTALLSALRPYRLLHPAILPAEKRIQRLPIKLQIATPQMFKQSPTRKANCRVHYAECVIRVHSGADLLSACCHPHRPPESAAQQLIRQPEIPQLRNAYFTITNRIGGTGTNTVLGNLSTPTGNASAVLEDLFVRASANVINRD